MNEEQQSIEEIVEEKLALQFKWLKEIREGIMRHTSSLETLLKIFREEAWEKHSPWYSLESYEALVVLYKVEDINEALKKIHGAMRKEGYVPKHLFDKEELSWRWKSENWEGDTSPPEIYINLVLVDGGKCKRVQIGTKELPVYEIQCDGEEIIAPEILEDN